MLDHFNFIDLLHQPYELSLVLFMIGACILLIMRSQLHRRSKNLRSTQWARNAKIIWIPWKTGPDSWLAHAVETSWRHHNPTWHIERVTESFASAYLSSDHERRIFASIASSDERMDFLRIHLIAYHGGVWIDPLLLCMRPLDAWIDQAIAPTGFFMYRYEKHALFRQGAVGFLAAVPDSYLLQAWHRMVHTYMNEPNRIHDPHWCMSLFEHLVHTDDRFLFDWNRTPKIWADAQGEAGMFVRTQSHPGHAQNQEQAVVLLHGNLTLTRLLRLHPPHVIQLPRTMAHWPMRVRKRIPKDALLHTLLHLSTHKHA